MLQSVYNIYLASSLSFTRGWALTDVGRYQEAINHLTQWIDIIERNAIVIAGGRCYNGLGWVYSELYDLSRAYDLNLRALEHAIALGQSPAFVYSASEMRAMAEVNLVENRFEMGMVDEAWDRIARFEEISADPAYDMLRHRWSTRMNDVKAAILLSRGDVGGAQALSERGLEVATRWSASIANGSTGITRAPSSGRPRTRCRTSIFGRRFWPRRRCARSWTVQPVNRHRARQASTTRSQEAVHCPAPGSMPWAATRTR
jgi:hypothetical protein